MVKGIELWCPQIDVLHHLDCKTEMPHSPLGAKAVTFMNMVQYVLIHQTIFELYSVSPGQVRVVRVKQYSWRSTVEEGVLSIS